MPSTVRLTILKSEMPTSDSITSRFKKCSSSPFQKLRAVGLAETLQEQPTIFWLTASLSEFSTRAWHFDVCSSIGGATWCAFRKNCVLCRASFTRQLVCIAARIDVAKVRGFGAVGAGTEQGWRPARTLGRDAYWALIWGDATVLYQGCAIDVAGSTDLTDCFRLNHEVQIAVQECNDCSDCSGVLNPMLR